MSKRPARKKPNKRSEAKDRLDAPGKPTPVVGIGASAGGIEAFSRFFPAVPRNSGLAYVVILHMSPAHESRLAETISRFTQLPVKQVAGQARIEPDCIYVIAPNSDLVLSNGMLRSKRKTESDGPRHSIDTFLISLAETLGESAASVILSGTGSDGTTGLRAIKEHGGLTLAQAGASAEYDGMMNSAIGTGLVDFVLRPEDMPIKLVDYFRHLHRLRGSKGPDGVQPKVADYLGQICAVLRARIGHDFSNYKDKTILRRVQRRMQVLQIEDVEDFLALLRKDSRQIELLFQDLLIGVTQFFRDPESFGALERQVIPKLFEGKSANDSVRVWIPGCSTGEEAYSIAMLLREHMPKSGVAKLQIFASDIDEHALETARLGRYPATIADHVSPERLQRHFVREDGTYRIVSDLREICLFSTHDLLRNAPFSKLDLISCRNLLIYFNGDLQNRVIPLFHYALRDRGYLFIGSSENVTRHGKLFDTVDKAHRIFQRRAHAARGLPHFPLVSPEAPPQRGAADIRTSVRAPTMIDRVERTMLERYTPAFIVINRDGDVAHFSGQTGNYLEPASGAPDHNAFRMARPGLRPILRATLHRSVVTGRTAVQKNVSVAVNGGTQKINLIVQPIGDGDGDGEGETYLVVFQNSGAIEFEGDEAVETVRDVESATLRELESELRSTRERLQATTEELEASNEELKSSNEELSSMNEELQSSNEELETSKEELQSINEELHTVNAELTARVDELSRAHSDMVNLLESTQIATIFLDRSLTVKSFTPAATDLFHLVESDAGRPLSHIRARFAGADGIADGAEKVLRTLATIEQQVTSNEDGNRYIMRILPYRTIDNVISGVVITFIDISGITAARATIEELNRALRERLQQMEILLEMVPAGIFIVEESDPTHIRINRQAAQLVGQEIDRTSLRELHGPLVLRADGRAIPDDQQPLWRAARTGKAVPFHEAEVARSDGSIVDVMVSAMPLLDSEGAARGAIAAMVDISERKSAAARQDILLHELQHRVKNILATVASLAKRLRRTSADLDGYVDALNGRLQAMGRTQELLSRRSDRGVRLRDLLTTAVVPHDGARLDSIRLSGPEVTLSAERAATLSMIVYELATNAAKYGALSTPHGAVALSWAIERADGAAKLALDWRESDGPAIAPPSGSGFGTSFIQRSVEYDLGGAVKFSFESDGLRCHLSFPEKP
jgi:two-component system, chemotaxis family, CheB/CheR fusion protein